MPDTGELAIVHAAGLRSEVVARLLPERSGERSIGHFDMPVSEAEFSMAPAPAASTAKAANALVCIGDRPPADANEP